jgi:type I restriction enzyme M protein
MTLTPGQIGNRVWNMAHVLKDDGVGYKEYVEQITFLLFLKMAYELTQPPYKRAAIVPAPYDWPNLLKRSGDDLEVHYRKTLEALGKQKGVLGVIFAKAKNEVRDPAKLRRLIVDLIEPYTWVSMETDVKGAIYEELLSRTAQESPSGAGQYFTPRAVIETMVEVIQPGPADTICDPAAGTGGFLYIAHNYVLEKHGPNLDRNQKKRVKEKLVCGMELVESTARLCAMNLYLHGIGGDMPPVYSGHDSLAAPAPDTYSVVLTNPPFGKKSSVPTVTDEGELRQERSVVVRQDFCASTTNKQLNFVQHIYTMLKVHGRAAVVLPDNVLFEGGVGETIRRNLLQTCDVHTLLRLPTGIFYKPGVKANVLFFEKRPGAEKPWTRRLWVYDLRTNMHFTLKKNPVQRNDFDDFVACYKPGHRDDRKPTWSEKKPDGRWRCFEYDELAKRDKLSLDLFWLRDESLEDSDNLPEPEVIAAEIADDLEAALEQFRSIAEELGDKA